MSTFQENNTLFNNLSCSSFSYGDTDVGFSFSLLLLLTNSLVGLPANLWTVWLICHGTTDGLLSEIHHLQLAVCEILYCLGLPTEIYCLLLNNRITRFWTHDLNTLLMLQLSLVWIGRPLFQCAICIERYIAVVHPLIFIR